MIFISHIVYLFVLDIDIDILFVLIFELTHVKVLEHCLIT